MDIVIGFNIEYFREKIHRFYARHSKEIITAKKLDGKLLELNKELETLLKRFVLIGIKEEDTVLVVMASAFGLEIKTFNKKHLLNKQDAVNKILKEEGMNEIVINEP